MAAIMEAALAKVLCELDKSGFDLAQTQMVQAEHLHAGAINQITGCVEVIQTRMRGGVLA